MKWLGPHELLLMCELASLPPLAWLIRVRGKRTREEMDDFYARFFDKAKTILAPKGIIIMYTNEVGFVKKQLRLHSEYKLVQETCILKKNDFYLFILECR